MFDQIEDLIFKLTLLFRNVILYEHCYESYRRSFTSVDPHPDKLPSVI